MTENLDKGRSAATLTYAARALHHIILTGFAQTGAAPFRANLDLAAREAGIDVGAAVAELADADLILFDRAGQIRAAYPFSPVPTRHQMAIKGGPTAYAMCAIDALGTSAMLGRPVTISSTEPDTGQPITVHVAGRTATWDPARTVVYAAAGGDDCCTTSADRTCATINFFTSRRSAKSWAADHPELTGRLLRQRDALALGIAEFGDLLQAQGARAVDEHRQ